MSKVCDNTSVGVLILNPENEMLLIKRGQFPVGHAPPAGHIDDHGSPEKTAVDEVNEEVGLMVTKDSLENLISFRRVENRCKRPNGDYHKWWVFRATDYEGDLTPDPNETKGATWYGTVALQGLADRTREYQAGGIDEDEWKANPGLEEIWLEFFEELGYVK